MRKHLYLALSGADVPRTIRSTEAAAELKEIVGERIIQASALGAEGLPGYEGIPERPFATYRMHTDFPLQRPVGRREYAQVWANDEPGDYATIDDILALCRIAIEGLEPTENFLEARWIETGVDLSDTAMGTINRYIRFQFTGTLRERE